MRVLTSILAGIAILGALIYFGLVHFPTRCSIIGENICYYYESLRLLENSSQSDPEWLFTTTMNLCGKMEASPKKNDCFYFIAFAFSRESEKEKAACSEVMDDYWYSVQGCLEHTDIFR